MGVVVLVIIATVSTLTANAQPPVNEQVEIEFDDLRLRAAVKKALDRGVRFIESQQRGDGSWHGSGAANNCHAGVTSLALLALINSDVPLDSPVVQKGLNFLRDLPLAVLDEQHAVYEVSLMIMALCAAEEWDRDLPRIQLLARVLEDCQTEVGEHRGSWSYKLIPSGGGDRSNGQYAVLGLREAAYAGAPVSRETWQRVYDHWTQNQLPSGAWNYTTGDGPRGSMTVAGLATVAISSRMLQTDTDVDDQGRPDCCSTPAPNLALEAGRRWLSQEFKVSTNPSHGGMWHFYYLYGLERAGRMTGVRFFGRHDWYREGAAYLVDAQLPAGNWLSPGQERDAMTNTAMAQIFLSKGLSRVVINKLDYNSPTGDFKEAGEWNRHPWDVTNLVELIDGLPNWPPRLINQVVTLSRLKPESATEELNQAPVLFISGRDAPQFTDEQIGWLRKYVEAGGFIFAVANCDGQGFDMGFRDIVKRMFPVEATLKQLTQEHPVYRSEYLLDATGVELWGVDFGCRTSIIYSPDDIGCLWQKWMKHEPKERNPSLSQRVIRGTRIGVNVVAYATGREPPEKLSEATARNQENVETIERGLLQVGKLRYGDSWDTAPKALHNLLTALNQTVGISASTKTEAIPVTLEEMSRFPLVYMHGRYRFRMATQQQQALRDYLNRGGVLFADACCGAGNFDRAFRDLARQLFPDNPMKEIPADHEMFTAAVGHEIKQATRRRLVPSEEKAALTMRNETGPPLLEGIEVDGRYVVIYSKYDISCALEHQASLSCDGYVEADAAKIAINVVLYSMLQDIKWSGLVSPNADVDHR